jgi:hypothetical protein
MKRRTPPIGRTKHFASKNRDLAPASVKKERIRGVKLRTVSTLVMLFALACLGAFIAERPTILASDSAPVGIRREPTPVELRKSLRSVRGRRAVIHRKAAV